MFSIVTCVYARILKKNRLQLALIPPKQLLIPIKYPLAKVVPTEQFLIPSLSKNVSIKCYPDKKYLPRGFMVSAFFIILLLIYAQSFHISLSGKQ